MLVMNFRSVTVTVESYCTAKEISRVRQPENPLRRKLKDLDFLLILNKSLSAKFSMF